jgi:glutaredoxin
MLRTFMQHLNTLDKPKKTQDFFTYSFSTDMKFTVYSKENCPYCFKVKQVMELTGSDHVVYTLGENFTKEEFYAEFGEGSTFPQVICDEKKLGGSVDTIKFLREQQLI